MRIHSIREAERLARLAPHWFIKKLSNKQFLITGAIVIGVWAGLTAVTLKIVVHYLQELLGGWGHQYVWIYFISPAFGILLTNLFVKYVLKKDFAKGTSHVLLAIAKRSSFLPSKDTFSHAVTSALTVGLGGSAGLESPIVQTGSAIGSTFASWFPLGYRDRTLLLACGAAAGIGTAFNAPIAGVLFALEVLIVDVNISAFIPLLIAGAVGALCSKVILAEGILLSFKNVSIFNYRNVPYYITLGLVCGIFSVMYQFIFLQTETFFEKYFKTGVGRFMVGAGLLGFLILFFPALFGEGYRSIIDLANAKPANLFIGSPMVHEIDKNLYMLGFAVLSVGLIKALAVSFTLSAGGNGGNFAPALLVGACVGFSFAFLLNTSRLATLPVSNFTLVAMAGLLTGIFHAPLTAIFLIAEITGGYELIIPLMIVSALSTAISRYANPHSLDEAKLAKAHGTIVLDRDAHVLSEFTIRHFLEKDFVKVPIGSSLRILVDAIAHSKRNIFPVVDLNGVLCGIVVLEDIRELMFNTSLYDTLTVNQLMQNPKISADINDDMSLVMEKFDKTGIWNIPVTENGKYVGFISKSQIFSNYRNKLKGE